jgi:hypothetical protein
MLTSSTVSPVSLAVPHFTCFSRESSDVIFCALIQMVQDPVSRIFFFHC